MPFNLQVPDRVPELTMAGMAAFGSGINQAGDAIAGILEKHKEEAKANKAYQTLGEQLGFDSNYLSNLSLEQKRAAVEGKQLKAAMDRVKQQTAMDQQRVAMEQQRMTNEQQDRASASSFASQFGSLLTGNSPTSQLGPVTPDNSIGASITRSVMGQNTRSAPASPSGAYLQSLMQNPGVMSSPHFDRVSRALDQIAEMQNAVPAGTFTPLAGNPGYGFVTTGRGTGTPIPLPGAAALLKPQDWKPFPGKLGESGAMFAQDAKGQVHVAQPHADSQFGNMMGLQGTGTAAELTNIGTQITAIDEQIAKHGEDHKSGFLGLSGSLKGQRADLVKKYNAKWNLAKQTGERLPEGFTPMQPPPSGKMIWNPNTNDWQ